MVRCRTINDHRHDSSLKRKLIDDNVNTLNNIIYTRTKIETGQQKHISDKHTTFKHTVDIFKKQLLLTSHFIFPKTHADRIVVEKVFSI